MQTHTTPFPQGTPPAHADRVTFLDALRGWAIIMVIVNHAGSITDLSGPVRRLTEFGAFGVQLFFVVSAYTIFLTFRRSLGRDETPARSFFIRRLMRIVPVYWAGVLLYTAVFGLGSRGWLDGPEPWHYPWHVLLLNVWHPLVQSSVVPGGWSISVEVMFYLTVPLWVRLVTTRRAAEVFAVVSVAIAPLVVWAISRVVHPDAPPEMLALYWHRLPFAQLPCFAMGIWLYFAVRDGLHLRIQDWRRNTAVWCLGFAMFVTAWKWPMGGAVYWYTASFTAMALALAAAPVRVAVNAATVFMGRISYSAYLIHFLALERMSVWVPQGTPYRFATVLGGAFVLTVPLSWLSFRAIETPMMGLGKQWIARLRAGRPTVAVSDA